MRKKIGDAQRGIPKSEEHCAALRAARAREDKTPTMCPTCGQGPYAGEIGVRRHARHRHPQPE